MMNKQTHKLLLWFFASAHKPLVVLLLVDELAVGSPVRRNLDVQNRSVLQVVQLGLVRSLLCLLQERLLNQLRIAHIRNTLHEQI